MLPPAACRIVNAVRAAPHEWRRWRSPVTPNQPAIRVYYGYEKVPPRDEVAGGGIVKCQDLNDRFPNTPQGGNLLYLVSSAIPPGYEPMVHFARKSGARLVLNQNGVAYPAWHGPGWESFNASIRRLLDRADYVVYQSRFCKTTADRFIGPVNVPSTILYNPVNTRIFAPSTMPREQNVQAPAVLVAGSHMQFYRVNQALEALDHLRRNTGRGRLLLAGRLCWRTDPAAAEAEVAQRIAALKITPWVTRLGPYTQDQAIPLLQSADILLHTKYNDPCPRLVVEALACGLPVVYSASGGVPELVGDLAGVGIPAPEDYDRLHPPPASALAQAIDRVWQTRPIYSAAARSRAVSLFDVQAWLDQHETIFRRLVS